MAARELVDYLENGNITHSVNFPAVSAPRTSEARVCVMHANVEGAISKITSVISGANINIANIVDKSKGDKAYMILDLDSKPADAVIGAVRALDCVIRVRVID